jgi:hypothetical protein
MYKRFLSSFDDVVKWYDGIRPLTSKYHDLEDDIRPVGQRRRKGERIIKINKNCYAIDGGDNFSIRDKAEIRGTAPIVWTRKPDGDYITVRNTSYASYCLYNFIRQQLPTGLDFQWYGGKQSVVYNGEKVTLPRPKYRPWVAQYVRQALKNGTQRSDMSPFYRKAPLKPDTECNVTFKQVGDCEFELVGDKPSLKVNRKYVNKSLKDKYRTSITELREYIEAMGMLFPKPSHGYNPDCPYRALSGVSEERIRSFGREFTGGKWLTATQNIDTTREIMSNPELGELRHYLAFDIWSISEGYRVTDEHERTLWRKRFNNYINDRLGLTTTKQVTVTQ